MYTERNATQHSHLIMDLMEHFFVFFVDVLFFSEKEKKRGEDGASASAFWCVYVIRQQQ